MEFRSNRKFYSGEDSSGKQSSPNIIRIVCVCQNAKREVDEKTAIYSEYKVFNLRRNCTFSNKSVESEN
jgi:hypothetical protein